MIYLTMLSRANIIESAYGILPLGHYLNVVREFVCVQVTWRAMLLGAKAPGRFTHARQVKC
jgi:hypothetical protein